MMMFGDENKNARNVGEAKVLAHWKQVAEESANNDNCPHVLNSSLIHLVNVPTLNLEANASFELANSDFYQQQLPATASSTTTFSNCLKLQVWLPKAAVYFILYYYVMKSVLTPLCMLQFFVFNLKIISHQIKSNYILKSLNLLNAYLTN